MKSASAKQDGLYVKNLSTGHVVNRRGGGVTIEVSTSDSYF